MGQLMPQFVYRQRNPQNTSYYQCVEDHFEQFEQVYDDRFNKALRDPLFPLFFLTVTIIFSKLVRLGRPLIGKTKGIWLNRKPYLKITMFSVQNYSVHLID